MIQADVLILGAGPAGLACALALLNESQCKVVMVDKGRGRAIPVGEHLQPPARNLLHMLDALDSFEQQQHCTSNTVASVWGNNGLHFKDYFTSLHGSGWHLDRAQFEQGLTELAVERGLAHYCGYRFNQAEQRDNCWLVSFTDGTETLNVSAQIVVDGSGRNAVFATKQGAEKIAVDRLNAVTCLFSDEGNGQTATLDSLVESAKEGWWYSASLKDKRLMVSFMTDKPQIQQLQLHKEAHFLTLLNQSVHTQHRVKDRTLQLSPKISDASSYILHPCYGNNWVAVGDAACGYDPLSAMGLCKALQSGLLAARGIAQSDGYHTTQSRSGRPLQSKPDLQTALAQYAAQTRADFNAFCNTKTTMYSNEQRWRNAPFWQNRLPTVWLNPKSVIAVNGEFQVAKRRAGDFWLSSDLALIWQLCQKPVSAFEVLQQVRKHSNNSYQDSWLIFGLQHLLTEKLLINVSG